MGAKNLRPNLKAIHPWRSAQGPLTVRYKLSAHFGAHAERLYATESSNDRRTKFARPQLPRPLRCAVNRAPDLIRSTCPQL